MGYTEDMSNVDAGKRQGWIQEFAAKLRFPQLFVVTALLFALDMFIPDVIPFADEIFLGLLTVLLANLKKEKQPDRPMKNVTPKD